MDLRFLDQQDVAQLASSFRESGMLVLSGVRLPSVFEPPQSDLVFLEAEGSCEVYMDAQVRYQGPNVHWAARMAEPPAAGGTRRILDTQPGFIAAMRSFLVAVELARAEAAPEEPVPVRAARRPQAERVETGLRDLVEEARALAEPPRFEGREQELRALMTNLLRETKPGVVIVGPAGVGKTTLVRMLAAELAWSDHLPQGLQNTPLYDLPLGSLLEDVRVVGDLERRVRGILEQPGRPIFFLDEIHQLVRSELAPLRDLIKPALADGDLRVIGATTTVEWGHIRDRAFARRFMELKLNEPSPAETHRMLTPRLSGLAGHHGITLSDAHLREAVMLADRYLPGRAFPDKALDVLDHAAALQQSAPGSQATKPPEGAPPLDRHWLLEATATQSGLDRALLDLEACQTRIDGAVTHLRTRLHGQNESLDRVGATLRTRAAMGFVGWRQALQSLRPSWDRRPLATFLACGPTGVGKSETARLLAEAFFGGRLITLNGSDVGPEARHGVAMWTGSPPGYVGSDQGGVLTTGLRTHGTSLILVDEVEKASLEAIQNVLLPLLGDGTVTDRNTGETLAAADCIVFCTSNVQPVERRRPDLGFGGAQAQDPGGDALRAALEGVLRPEILGRFHAILRYSALDQATRWLIFEDLLRELEAQLGDGARLELDAQARALLDEALAAQPSGARGIRDLFREQFLPLVVGRGPGEQTRITAREGRLVRGEEG